MSDMIVEKRQPVHHPRLEAAARVPRDFAYDVHPVFEPLQLRTRGRREDRGLAILALITILHAPA
jgi:hypothetical protein